MSIDYERLKGLVGAGSYDQSRNSHRGWIEEYLGNGDKSRQDEWSKSIALGSMAFVEAGKKFLEIRAKERDVIEGGENYHLREEAAAYEALFEAVKFDIGNEKAYFWDVKSE